MIYVFYPLLLILLLFGCKPFGKEKWNEGFLSREQTKNILGFFAVCIIFHHVSQKTCAPWLPEKYTQSGLEPFVGAGYLFVAFFMFCSGFGLTKSAAAKKDYFSGFFSRRILPLLIPFVLTSAAFFLLRDGWSFPTHPYAWYVYAIIVMYLGFYLCFGKLKKHSLAAFAVFVLLYCLVLHLLIFDDYWINTVPCILLGAVFARFEQKITSAFKKAYIPLLCLTAALTALLFLAGNNADGVYHLFGERISYRNIKELQLLCEILCGGIFCVFTVLASMKLKIGSKALSFLGTMTLEIYLVHGIFVELFGYCFINGSSRRYFYISNIFLYTLAVIAVSIPAAFLLKKAGELFLPFLKKSDYFKFAAKVIKRMAIVVCCAGVIVLAFSFISSRIQISKNAPKLEQYRNENITFAEADGRKMAAYCTGKGEHTIVILSSEDDMAPTIALKGLADELSAENSVIVLDLLGRGFSDDTDRERTSANIAEEIHEALGTLAKTDRVILLGDRASCIYCREYAGKYKDSVEKMVLVDSYGYQLAEAIRGDIGLSDEQFAWEYEKSARKERLVYRILSSTGLIRYMDITSKASPLIMEHFIANSGNKAVLNERSSLYGNCRALKEQSISPDIPVLFILDSYLANYGYMDINWKEMCSGSITNEEIQSMVVVEGSPEIISGKVAVMSEQINKFILQISG